MDKKKSLVLLMKKNAKIAGTIIHEIPSIEAGFKYVMDLCKENNLQTLVSPELDKEYQERLKDQCDLKNVSEHKCHAISLCKYHKPLVILSIISIIVHIVFSLIY